MILQHRRRFSPPICAFMFLCCWRIWSFGSIKIIRTDHKQNSWELKVTGMLLSTFTRVLHAGTVWRYFTSFCRRILYTPLHVPDTFSYKLLYRLLSASIRLNLFKSVDSENDYSVYNMYKYFYLCISKDMVLKHYFGESESSFTVEYFYTETESIPPDKYCQTWSMSQKMYSDINFSKRTNTTLWNNCRQNRTYKYSQQNVLRVWK